MSPSKLRTSIHAAVLAAILYAVPARALATNVSTVLSLVTATPTANTFDITVDVLGSQDTQSVVYTGVLRPAMNIDFTNPAAPIVQTLDFNGLDADVSHADATFSVPLGTAKFTGVSGRIKTLAASSPAPVTGGTTFSAADHQLIAWHGTIDVTPIIGPPTAIDIFQNTFRGTFSGNNNSQVHVTLASLVAGVATYDVDVTAVLDDVLITTGKPQIDDLIKIFITGNVVAHGQFTQAIPEPASVTLLIAGVALARAMRRRTE